MIKSPASAITSKNAIYGTKTRIMRNMDFYYGLAYCTNQLLFIGFRRTLCVIGNFYATIL